MTTYRNVSTRYGTVLQVVQTTFTTVFYTNSNGTWVDVTNFYVNITPSSTSSKILLLAQICYGADHTANPCLRFAGGNAGNYVGDTRSNRRRVAFAGGDDYFYNASTAGTNTSFNANMHYLDSPGTTSQITYKIQAMGDANGGICINRDMDDPDSTGEGYTCASSLIAMEIAA